MSKGTMDNELQKIWENQEFKPPENGWSAMERALAGTKEEAPKKVIGWGVYYKTAAAVLILGLGSFSVWFLNREEPGLMKSPIAAEHKLPAPKVQLPEALPQQAPDAQMTGSGTELTSRQEQQMATRGVRFYPPVKGLAPLKVDQSAMDHSQLVTKEPQKIPVYEVPLKDTAHSPVMVKQEAPKSTIEQKSGFEPIINNNILPEERSRSSKALDVGVLANVGKSSLGNLNYNVGVVLRKEWNNFYTEASVSMASTDVRFSEKMRYGVAYSSGDMTNAEGINSIKANTIGETENTYENNVFGVGITPTIGYKLGKYVSLAVGVDVYRNINNTLNLSYNSDLTRKKIKNVPGSKNVSDWDSGIKGQLGWKVTNSFSLQAQYRRGISNYIISEAQNYKNSILNIGFIYRFQ